MSKRNSSDRYYMSYAIKLARNGLYSTHPNPRVGCVVVQGDEIVGAAWHHQAGEPHAEILALRQAGERARGSTVYVNMEPCCHQGRTPPCTGSLIDAGVKRVIAGMQDPNPQVAGGGIAHLRSSGIDVEVGLLETAAVRLNRGFIHRINLRRPWVTMKVAASLDGRTALRSGESQWITGEYARRDGHHWRARSSAVMTGSGTVLADDPALTARDVDTSRQPLRVVVDSNLVTPANAKVLDKAGEVLIATAVAESEKSDRLAENVDINVLSDGQGKVHLPGLMNDLASREINEVLVEAGPTLNGALLAAGLVDEILIYFAPKILGSGARGMFDLPELKSIQSAGNFDLLDVRQFGDDLRLRLTPRSIELDH